MDIYGYEHRKIYFTNYACANKINSVLKYQEPIDIKDRGSVLLIKSINEIIFNNIEETLKTLERLLKTKSSKIKTIKDIMGMIIVYIKQQVLLLSESANFFQYNLGSNPCNNEYYLCSNTHVIPIYFSK